MQCEFKNTTGETFILGSVSMNILDQNNVFDDYQEDHDEMSNIIFKTTGKEKTKALSDLVLAHSDKANARTDISEKLKKFSIFLSNSDGVVMTIR